MIPQTPSRRSVPALALIAAWLLLATWLVCARTIEEQTLGFALLTPLLFWGATRNGALARLNLVALSLSLGFCLLQWIVAPRRIEPDCDRPLHRHEPGQEVHRLLPGAEAECSRPGAFRHRVRIDELGHRLVPASRGLRPHLPTVALFGCSYTFGFGVTEEETYANRLQERMRDRYRVVNAGLIGTGPSTLLRMLERPDAYLADLPPHLPKGVFLFFPNHVARVNAVNSWRFEDGYSELPRYELVGGVPVYRGSVGERGAAAFLRRKFSPGFARALALSLGPVEDFWRRQQPTYFTHAELALTEAVLIRAAELFRKKYGGEFVLYAYPNHVHHSYLKSAGFFTRLSAHMRVIEYPNPKELPPIPNDRHPSAEAHARLGAFLAEHL